jgi:hypothetical protein
MAAKVIRVDAFELALILVVFDAPICLSGPFPPELSHQTNRMRIIHVVINVQRRVRVVEIMLVLP